MYMSHAHPRGFTLIEMLTVIAIIIILTGILFANFRNFGGTARLEQDATELASLIRTARQDSISVVQHGTEYPSYGVYVYDSNAVDTIELYAACGVDLTSGDYHRGGAGNTCSAGQTVEGLTLRGSTISDIEYSTNNANIDGASILFVRPDPIIQMYRHTGVSSVQILRTGTLTITLTSTDGTGDTRTVSVNSNGHIRIGN
jgi:prepilin-type N-terminal cleavage/methylation domain-containing protein